MRKIILTVGLQASGKSTWAVQYCKDHPKTVRVNKDSLRLMVYGEPYNPQWEDLICELRDSIVSVSLLEGYDVVVDDTNFAEKHRKRIEEVAALHSAIVEVKDFTHVPLEVCLERNRNRPNPVPEAAIIHMYERYILNARKEE